VVVKAINIDVSKVKFWDFGGGGWLPAPLSNKPAVVKSPYSNHILEQNKRREKQASSLAPHIMDSLLTYYSKVC
jgi:hypothetical protein